MHFYAYSATTEHKLMKSATGELHEGWQAYLAGISRRATTRLALRLHINRVNPVPCPDCPVRARVTDDKGGPGGSRPTLGDVLRP